LEGRGGERLLASYKAERRPIGARNISFARDYAISISDIPITAEIENDTAAGREERARVGPRFAEHAFREFVIPGVQLGLSYAGSPIVAPDGTTPPKDVPNIYTPSACPGLRAPHMWLGREALFDRFGIGFTLLRMGEADGSAIVEAAKSRGVPLEVLDAQEARGIYEAELALIRPDQHVAWRGNAAPSDSLALIDHVRGG
jgi:hypothetical protein